MDVIKPRVMLKYRDRIKGIPYPSCDNGESMNHGFKLLKNRTKDASLIAEVQDNECLKQALIDINDEATSFFTIGCEKTFDNNGQGFFGSGYIEIAFNYKEMVESADNYFRLFMHFTKVINNSSLTGPIQYEWEIEPAFFTDAAQNGFSVTVWVCCGLYAEIQQAKCDWEKAIIFLSDFLRSIHSFNLSAIYK